VRADVVELSHNTVSCFKRDEFPLSAVKAVRAATMQLVGAFIGFEREGESATFEVSLGDTSCNSANGAAKIEVCTVGIVLGSGQAYDDISELSLTIRNPQLNDACPKRGHQHGNPTAGGQAGETRRFALDAHIRILPESGKPPTLVGVGGMVNLEG
jgi:hypothetical protein